MLNKHMLAALPGIAWALAVITSPEASGSRCSLNAAPATTRDSAATYVVGVGTDDTVPAGPGDIGRRLLREHDSVVGAATMDRLLARPGADGDRLRRERRSEEMGYGQVVQVDTFAGAGADRMRRAFAVRHSREIVIVPWGYDMGCRTDFWQSSARWIAPDSSGLFNLRLRPDSQWVAGRPTFDALLPGVRSYLPGWLGDATLRVLAKTPFAADRLLTPIELFGIIVRLPLGLPRADTTATATLRNWVESHPELRTSYPGNYILQVWFPTSR